MPTTTTAEPLRPRGAARAAVNRAVVRKSSGAVVTTPAAPEPTVVHGRRAARRAPGPRLRLSVRPPAMVPLVVVGLATSFLVAESTPQQAAASVTGTVVVARTSSGSAADPQDFTAPRSAFADVERDGFVVGSGPALLARIDPADVVRPVAGTVPVAGGFGGRSVPGCGACSTNHHGLDFAASTGMPAVSAMPGRVVSAGVSGGYGNQVLVQHGSGLQTRYAHLSAIDVTVGQVLRAGDRVGAVGSTGVSTGAHLHFEVIVAGRPVDPAAWLQDRGLL